jgi:hypothetical protein
MALGPNEQWRGGFVVDTSTTPARMVITYSLVNAQWQSGFLRDPDGRLVVRDA